MDDAAPNNLKLKKETNQEGSRRKSKGTKGKRGRRTEEADQELIRTQNTNKKEQMRNKEIDKYSDVSNVYGHDRIQYLIPHPP